MWSFGILLWEIYSFGRVPYPRIVSDIVTLNFHTRHDIFFFMLLLIAAFSRCCKVRRKRIQDGTARWMSCRSLWYYETGTVNFCLLRYMLYHILFILYCSLTGMGFTTRKETEFSWYKSDTRPIESWVHQRRELKTNLIRLK